MGLRYAVSGCIIRLGSSANLKCIYVFSRPYPSAQRLRWSVGHVRQYHRHYHKQCIDVTDHYRRRPSLERASSFGVYTFTHRAGRWTEGEDSLLTLVHLPAEPYSTASTLKTDPLWRLLLGAHRVNCVRRTLTVNVRDFRAVGGDLTLWFFWRMLTSLCYKC